MDSTIEALVAHIAKPLLASLGAQIVWPVAVATPLGRNHDDSRNHRSRESSRLGAVRRRRARADAGFRVAGVPIWRSARRRSAMRCWSYLARSSLPEDRMARNRIEVERLLNETRNQGFGMAHRARRVSEETSLAIPVRAKDRILATVTVRYAATAVPLRTAVEQFLPKMREVAQKIEAQFSA